jgi:4-amino-4-deoxy-L-arabinose transferase-like glycosyltransferase
MQRFLSAFIVWIAWSFSALALAAYLVIAVQRMGYPFALEWIEANTYHHVARVLAGQPIYTAPSYHFIPMIYTPLYYYLSAPLAALVGDIMLAMRLVSVTASLACFGLLYLIARERGLPAHFSALAAGLFAAAYGLTGFWFDIGRVDSLFVALLLGAVYLVVRRAGSEIWMGIAAGFVICLAYAAKQQGIILLPILVLILLSSRRYPKALALAVVGSFGALAWTGAIQVASSGWFWFYTMSLPAAAPRVSLLWNDFWRAHFWPTYFPALLLLVGWAVLGLRSVERRSALRAAQLALICAPLCALSLLSMVKQWGYVNGLMPLAAAFGLLAAEAAHGITRRSDLGLWGGRAALGAVAVLILLQFGQLRYDPTGQIPSEADRQAGTEMVRIITASEDPIYAPYSPHLLLLAGKPGNYHFSSMGDLTLAAQHNPAVNRVFTDWEDALALPPLVTGEGALILPAGTFFEDMLPEGACQDLLPGGQGLATFSGGRVEISRLCRGR